ncbi:MAG: hypothetical protein BWY73_01241 [candidate division TA06 bacterium ADurb.Bin417]|uniref:Uncharacterized protein n=1 Tax=candidate division TA06 bacterium ADurb.Bin417 TaxID=1852828 RepID=A0A1V5MCA0_UNCT6|nr:MAG: hypothetical protein BWY73_01241 [candidate division TA06 bacterium ADurb.Bin417]
MAAVNKFAPEGRAQTPAQHLLVGGRPAKTGGSEPVEGGRADRALGRPAAGRVPSKDRAEEKPGLLQLERGVFRERMRPLQQQGQDRVVVGRDRKLDLARILQPAPLGDDAPGQLVMVIEQPELLRLSEIPPLALQLSGQLILPAQSGIDPGQVEEYLQVAEFGDGKITGPALQHLGIGDAAALLQQLPVAREREQHRLPVQGEEIARQIKARRLVQLVGRPAGEFAEIVVRPAPGDIQDLFQEHRGNIESGAHRRVAPQETGKGVIILDRVQAHPGHPVPPGIEIQVAGLVKVPKKDDLERLSHRSKSPGQEMER